MFRWWGGAVIGLRWLVLAGTGVLLVVGVLWGTGVFGVLSTGGFDDPGSPSSVAAARIEADFGHSEPDVLVLYTDDDSTVDSDAVRGPVSAVLDRLRGRPETPSVISYYTTTGAAQLVSRDRHSTYVAIQLRDGDINAKRRDLAAIAPLMQAGSGVRTDIGGGVGFQADAGRQIQRDVERAEVLSLPVLLVLLLLIFRGLVAAAMPLLVGVVATLGAFTVTRVLAGIIEVSVFATNVVTLLGLGMAIDYSLFVVSRYREELAAGHPPSQAIARTIATAGRTVVVSGLTVALALSSMLLFPTGFLRSVAYGGMAAVVVAMLAALTTLPAALVLLGRRVNTRRSRPGRHRRSTGGGWARLARAVMSRPVLVAVGVAAALFGLAAPFLQVQFGGFDERVLPAGTPSRVVAQRLASGFEGYAPAPILALVE